MSEKDSRLKTAGVSGYNMARITPTQVVVNGPADLDPQIYRVIDQKVCIKNW